MFGKQARKIAVSLMVACVSVCSAIVFSGCATDGSKVANHESARSAKPSDASYVTPGGPGVIDADNSDYMWRKLTRSVSNTIYRS